MWLVALTITWTGTLALALAAGRWSREQRIDLYPEDLDLLYDAVETLERGGVIGLERTDAVFVSAEPGGR